MARRLFIFLDALVASAFFVARAAAAPPAPTQVIFSNVQATSLTVNWQASTGPTIQFTVQLSSSGFLTPLSSTTVLLTSTFTALDVNTQFFAQVQAQDTSDSSTSTFTAAISTYTLAQPPISLSTTVVSFTGVGLAWNGNGNPAGTVFSLERSTDGVSYAPVVSQTTVTYMDQGVSQGTTYAYRVRAFNKVNVPTAYSNVVSVTTPGSTSLPKTPPGLTAVRTQTGPSTFQIAFQWHHVGLRTDGSTLANLTGYQIYKSTSLLAPRSQWVNISTPTTESWTTTTDGSVSYYAWRTVDTNGMTSAWSQVLDDGADPNHFFTAADFVSRVQLPGSAAKVLVLGQNKYGSDLEFTLTEATSEETGKVAKSLQFKIINYDTGNEITDLVFDPPVLRGVIAYTVQNGQVVQGAPGQVALGDQYGLPLHPAGVGAPAAFSFGVPLVNAAQAADQLSLFWFNGNDWVKTTGVVNTADNTVSFTGSRAGRYQIRAASHVAGLILTRVYPRIITPNGDGWNDKAIFQFDNPQLLPLAGKIYDITNVLVADLKPGPNPDSTLQWDGTDSSGSTCIRSTWAARPLPERLWWRGKPSSGLRHLPPEGGRPSMPGPLPLGRGVRSLGEGGTMPEIVKDCFASQKSQLNLTAPTNHL